MPLASATGDEGDRYAVRHNPWTYFVDERRDCIRHDVPIDELAADVKNGRLPNAALVVPDLCHDGNRVLTLLIHPRVQDTWVETPLTHYSLSRLFSEVLGVPPLRNAASAPSMAYAFGLPLPGPAIRATTRSG